MYTMQASYTGAPADARRANRDNLYARLADFDRTAVGAAAPPATAERVEALQTIARRLERGCLNAAVLACADLGQASTWVNPSFVARYSANVYAQAVALDPADPHCHSADYCAGLLAGRIDPRATGGLTTAELHPEGSGQDRQVVRSRQRQQVVVTYTDKVPCPKCQGRRVTYEVASRSASDEISKLGYRCADCQYYWLR